MAWSRYFGVRTNARCFTTKTRGHSHIQNKQEPLVTILFLLVENLVNLVKHDKEMLACTGGGSALLSESLWEMTKWLEREQHRYQIWLSEKCRQLKACPSSRRHRMDTGFKPLLLRFTSLPRGGTKTTPLSDEKTAVWRGGQRSRAWQAAARGLESKSHD